MVKQLAGKAIVISPKANGGDSSNVLNGLYSALSEPGQPFGVEDLIGNDGVHLQPEAEERLGKAVAEFIGLQIVSGSPQPSQIA